MSLRTGWRRERDLTKVFTAVNRLVVHHIYSGGLACDLSGYRNHGLPYDVIEATAPFAPAFSFASGDSAG